MKYIKLFEFHYDEWRYERFSKELEIYMDFFKEEWKYNGEIGKIVSIDNFKDNVGIILSKDSRRVLISIGKDNRALVHVYVGLMSETNEDKKRTSYKFNLLTDWGMMKTRWNNRKPYILDLLKESKERAFKPILRVYESKQKPVSEGDPTTNILGNIFSNDILEYIHSENKNDEYIYLIPYFIFFSDDDTIMKWWNDESEYIRNSNLVYGVSNAIIKDPFVYNKFKKIIGDDVSVSGGMFDMGFSD
jgi:hypothetical protein